MIDETTDLHPTPIPGARPDTPHPARRMLHGLAELAAVAGQALLALSEIVHRRRDDVDPPEHRKRRHPIDKTASFPIND